ncbi:MAG: hypothetical protein QW041_03755, partial [Candidatus Pacearchaeota archaeon]
VSLGVIFLISLSYIRKSVKLSFGYIPKAIIATLAMAAVVWLIRTSTIMGIEKVVLIVILGVGIYFVSLWLLKGFDKTDKNLITKILKLFQIR